MNNNQYYEFNQNTNIDPKLIEKKIYKNNDNDKNKFNNNIPFFKKLKIAIYCFILFIILSNKNSYKILDIIIKIFRENSDDIINDSGKPQLLGIIIMGLIFSIFILILS